MSEEWSGLERIEAYGGNAFAVSSCCKKLFFSKVTLDVEVQVFQAPKSEMHIVVLHEVSAFEGALLIVSLIQRLCFP